MEDVLPIVGVAVSVVAAVAAVGGGVAYWLRRRANGAAEAREALIRLYEASDEGAFIFTRGHGLYGEAGKRALRDLRRTRTSLVDRKLTRLVDQIEDLYIRGERAAIAPGQTSAWEYAARRFEDDQPSLELVQGVPLAISRASKLVKRRAGSG